MILRIAYSSSIYVLNDFPGEGVLWSFPVVRDKEMTVADMSWSS